MKRLAILFLLLASPVFAGPTLELPKEVKGDVAAFVPVPATTSGKAVKWLALDAGLNVFPVDLLKDTKTAVVSSARAGRYRLMAITCAGDELSEPSICIVVVGNAPGPTPPKPPDPPKPPPVPPTPASGLKVLVVYESGDLSKLSAAQQAVLYAKPVRDYLNAKCIAGPDGKTKEWRIYDADVDLSGEAKFWQDAMKRPRQSLPWVFIQNDKASHEGPLPADADKMLELLKRFGGQ